MGPSFIKLKFKRPKDFGYDETIIGSKYCKSLVCAIGEDKCAAAMTHKWYDVEGGVMFCSRFWIGMTEKDGKIVVPADFLAQCASFGHGALRGIMYLKTMNTPLEGIVLPPVVYGEMFKKPITFDKTAE